MAGFTREITIDQPQRHVFAYATDPARFMAWMPSVINCTATPDAPLRKGSVIDIEMSGGKNSMTQKNTVSIFERPTDFALTARHIGVQAIYHYRFVQAGDTTHIRLDAHCTTPWWLAPFSGLIARAMEKADGDMLVLLKQAIELDVPGQS